MTQFIRLFALAILIRSLSVNAQEVVPLYDRQIPFAKEVGEIPKMTIYKPSKKSNGIGVIICSGGSYSGRANIIEGLPSRKKLIEAGITAILLDYRVPNIRTMSSPGLVPMTDVRRAIQYVRENAKKNEVG